MEVMSLSHCLCLVILVVCHYAALERLETEEDITAESLLASHSAEGKGPATFNWPSGVVPYLIEPHYDDIIVARIRAAMNTIESSSCVLFKDVKVPPPEEPAPIAWLVIQNPEGVRECSHSTLGEQSGAALTKAILVLGYDCMQRRDILHALLHALGFNDEVTHPQRDMYVRIMWGNIQPKYRSLFWMRTGGTPHKMVEYDSLSIMHFHNRAYSVNGGPTILPLISDLTIAPTDKLSQLDVMKLRLAFGHDCNKRKVGNLLDTCQNVLRDDDNEQAEKSGENSDDNEDDDNEQADKSGENSDDNEDEDNDQTETSGENSDILEDDNNEQTEKSGENWDDIYPLH